MKIDIARIMLLSYHNDIKFEYDKEKSKSNKEKHGIDFEEAKALWFDFHVIVETQSPIEQRFLLIGKLAEKFYSCFFTVRGTNSIRFISVRCSRKLEKVRYYEQEKNQKNHRGRAG
ncbi:MAG: BrnT family toxin [Coxiellaceae bacterium]|nr:BrnT family toxin [Coxiellaceae bacterium]